MDGLAWALLLLGGLVLGAIYLTGKLRELRRPGRLIDDAGRAAEDLGRTVNAEIDPLNDDLDQLNRMINERFEPAPEVSLDGPATDAVPLAAEPPASRPRAAEQAGGRQTAPGSGQAEKLVVLHLAAPRGQVFHGPELVRLLESRGYQFGDLNIFHALHQGSPLFSVVNMVKPGWFDLANLDRFNTPGISLFMQLPGSHPAPAAFDVLLSEAQHLAEALGARLQDADHSTLTRQTIQHLREQMVEFQNRRAGGGRGPARPRP